MKVRIVVLRLGQVVFDGATKSVSQAELVQLMAGIVPKEMQSH